MILIINFSFSKSSHVQPASSAEQDIHQIKHRILEISLENKESSKVFIEISLYTYDSICFYLKSDINLTVKTINSEELSNSPPVDD